jgi:hypothetical protein
VKNIILIITLLSLCGCMTADLSSKGKDFEIVRVVPEGKSVAYFYTKESRGGNACWLIGIDSVRTHCLGFPGFAVIVVNPGNREISTTPNSPIKIANGKFAFEFKPGKSYFFEYDELFPASKKEEYIFTFYNAAYGTSFGWKVVSEEQALPEISKLKSWQ